MVNSSSNAAKPKEFTKELKRLSLHAECLLMRPHTITSRGCDVRSTECIVKFIERYTTSHTHSFFLSILQYHVYAKMHHKQQESNYRNDYLAKIEQLPHQSSKQNFPIVHSEVHREKPKVYKN